MTFGGFRATALLDSGFACDPTLWYQPRCSKQRSSEDVGFSCALLPECWEPR